MDNVVVRPMPRSNRGVLANLAVIGAFLTVLTVLGAWVVRSQIAMKKLEPYQGHWTSLSDSVSFNPDGTFSYSPQVTDGRYWVDGTLLVRAAPDGKVISREIWTMDRSVAAGEVLVLVELGPRGLTGTYTLYCRDSRRIHQVYDEWGTRNYWRQP